MLNDLFIRAISMSREEKGLWHLMYKSLLQLREEFISRVFNFMRSSAGRINELMKTLSSILDDKSSELSDLLKSQLVLVARNESDFWKSILKIPLKNYPRKLISVNDAPLYSGAGNLFSRIFNPVKKKLKAMLQFSVSQNHSIDQTLDRVFGKETSKEINVKSWRGTEFQGGVLAKVRKSLQSLAVTAYYEMIAKVRKFAFARTDRVQSIRSTSSLEGNTTEGCKKYEGLVFGKDSLQPISHQNKYEPVPRHWNCRSQYIPNDFDGKSLEPISMVDWFKGLSIGAQNSLLGKKGGELYRNKHSDLLIIMKRLSPVYLS